MHGVVAAMFFIEPKGTVKTLLQWCAAMKHGVVLGAMLLVFACEAKHPVMPSYFTAERPADAPPTCKENLECYARCAPPVEECMLRCDQCGVAVEVARARAVSTCGVVHQCFDQACIEQECAPELATCTARRAGGPPVMDTFCPEHEDSADPTPP